MAQPYAPRLVLAGFGGSYAYLLASLLLFFVLHPFFEEGGTKNILLDVFLSAVLIAGTYTVVHSKARLIIALCLGVPAIIARWTLVFVDTDGLIVATHVFMIAFFGFNTVTVLWHIMSEREITQDTIYGAICGYLLLGLCWALVFSLIETMVPGSFAVIVTPAGDPERLGSLMFYYSFTSLTTLGYGDIVPISPITRSFSTLEAVMGQLYLTVLVARLVGLHTSREGRTIDPCLQTEPCYGVTADGFAVV